ncbi:MAG: MFS transporter [Eggerthellaceae bacterium]|nr:MFS transporter [Eggerthellaceae bacterium]
MTNADKHTGQNKRRGFLSANFVLLFVAHFLVVGVYFLFMTTMVRHAIQAFSCSDSTAGLVASIFLVGGAFARILSGRYADAIGLKRSSIAAIVLMLASCASYFVGDTSLPIMLAIRFLHGVSFGIANTTMPALVTEIIPLEVMGEGTGWFMLSNSLGTGVGPLFGLLVSGSFEYSTLYIVCTALSAVALAATILLSAGKPPSEGARSAMAKVPKFKLSSVLDPATRRFSFYMFLVALSYSSVNSFVDAYSTSIGLEGWAAGLFIVYSVTLVILRPPVGRLQDRRGDNAVLYPSIACAALTTLVCGACSLAPSPTLLMCTGVFAAAGFGTCMSAGLATVGRLAGGTKAAPGIAMFYLLCDFGCGIGPFLLGFIVGSLGYPAMYMTCSAIALIGLAYYHFAYGKNAR